MSITQLAKELKVSRARVYQIIDSLDNSEKPKKKDDRYILDEKSINAIRNYFIKTSTKSSESRQNKNISQDSSQVLRILESQLDEKDKQIERLQKLVDQSQQLQLQTQKQLSSANEKVKQLESAPKSDSKDAKNKTDINTNEQVQNTPEDVREPKNGIQERKWWQVWK